MKRLYAFDDFEAIIRIFTEAEGGRKTPPFNGIRWDLSYIPSDNVLHGIMPDFYSCSGDSLPTNVPLPIDVEIPARMTIRVDEMREKTHRARIAPGVQFYCHEGAHRLAIGRVTRITGLHVARPKAT